MKEVKFVGKENRNLFENDQDKGKIKDVPQRLLEVGEKFEEKEKGKIVTRQITKKQIFSDGSLIVASVQVGERNE